MWGKLGGDKAVGMACLAESRRWNGLCGALGDKLWRKTVWLGLRGFLE